MRVLALSPSSSKLLELIGIWPKILESGRSAPYYDMSVWDAMSHGVIHFRASDVKKSVLGYVVEASLINDATYGRLEELKDKVDVIAPDSVESIDLGSGGNDMAKVMLKGRGALETRLVIGCDGANSTVKKLVGAKSYGWKYGQKGVVSTVKFEEGVFCGTAFQRFLPSGPVALLPMFDNYGSVVWSTTRAQADALVEMKDEEFAGELRRAFNARYVKAPPFPFSMMDVEKVAQSVLQPIFGSEMRTPEPPVIESVVGKRASFPLQLSQTTPYYGTRFALVGDAAHVVHPLAGQGFNLGLGDIASLTTRLCEAVMQGSDIGSEAVLCDYGRKRTWNNSVMMGGIDGLQKVFQCNNFVFNGMRGLGMIATSSISPLKNILIQNAMGESIDFKHIGQ